MKVDAEVRTTERVKVEINPVEVIERLHWKWVQESGPKEAEYINRDGAWESWVDTHGSGITNLHGKASDEQIEADKAFKLVLKIVKELKKGV